MIKKYLRAAGLLAILILGLAVAAAETASGTCGTSAVWNVDTETGVLTIGGSGVMTDWPNAAEECAGWYSYLMQIREVRINGAVTSIGRAAFASMTALEKVTIPKTVQTIGLNAFGGCKSLTTVIMEDGTGSIGQYAFSGTGIREIVIPGSVGSIGNYAFMNCTGLQQVSIGSGVTAIGSGAFSGCGKAMIRIDRVQDACTGFAADAFADALQVWYKIPGYEIGTDGTLTHYSGCEAHVVIPDGVSAVGDGAFRNCGTMLSVQIPDTVTGIGAEAFAGCTGLGSIRIPQQVSSIGKDALAGCTALMSVVNDSQETIALPEVTGCTWHTPGDLLLGIHELARGKALRVTDSPVADRGTVWLPEKLTAVEQELLSGIAASAVYIGSHTECIGARAFADCSARIMSIHIPVGVKTIAPDAFRGTTVILYGAEDSAAQRFAEKYGLIFIAE